MPNFEAKTGAMTQIVLTIPDEKDLDMLLPLLSRLGITFSPASKQGAVAKRRLAELQKIVLAGGDASYFGDPAEWQRAQRTERSLPFSAVEMP
ncbi:MAG: hypothetical protein ACK4Q5_13025 [Saprospiraceae bacterium]